VPASAAPSSRPLDQLVNDQEPGWPLVEHLISHAKNKVDVLPTERAQGEKTLVAIQVTTRSPMGAVAYKTGGMLVDHGWIRILGAGHPRLPRSLATWNFPDGDPARPRLAGAFLVADDVLGGFFALNAGAFDGPASNVFYFAPDTQQWEDSHGGYTKFLELAMSGDLDNFYKGRRWTGWEATVEPLAGDRAFDFTPILSARTDGGIESRQRTEASLDEIWRAYAARR
jgi:hypothetical protein